jgi:glucosamine--fructose-6-phosphate aminotransferase (isomerizing)
MCGIFGLIASAPGAVPASTLKRLVRKLYEQSETRGKDAAGIVFVSDEQILVYKESRRASLMLKSRHLAEVLAQAEHSYSEGKSFVIAGHTRMVTNGSESNEKNNQPVIKDDVVLLHNGIIVNDLALWQSHPDLQRQFQVDTEVFGALVSAWMRDGQSMFVAMKRAFSAAKGANTIAVIHAGEAEMLLGTTTGSLYFWEAPVLGLSLFGSEKYILEQVLPMLADLFSTFIPVIQQVKPGDLLALSLSKGKARVLSADTLTSDAPGSVNLRRIRELSAPVPSVQKRVRPVSNTYAEIERHMNHDAQRIADLKRCTRCLLPETFPFIEFNSEGVCQFCRQHRPTPLRGEPALHELADQIRRVDGQQDCLVPISGGRDSCYGLHYIKKELGLNPVAYTYDWGFVTDLARRNISRICGELNVEHVLVAADIKQKRENVRKNVSAWLLKPTLSMIPLFMAGDKQFFYYASKVKKQMGLGPILFSMNSLEKTGFKTGFAGINETCSHEKTYGLTTVNQFKLVSHYTYNFFSNPRYINGSLPDTLFGYFSYYLKAKDYYSIFDYLTWDQRKIESCITGDYGWETSPDTKSTWRIGDGTAPFYNYIYLTIAGFTENDTFRSNQIREGMIDRTTALQVIKEENRPRVESFKWYCDTIGLDAVSALKAINAARKLDVPR